MTARFFSKQYYTLLKAYIHNQEEEQLAAVANLGRELVLKGLLPEDIAEIHEQALERLGREHPDMRIIDAACLISAPLMEMLMSYGMAFREQQETRKQAEEALEKHRENLEKTVKERTAELQKTINLMADREVRMAELKKTIKKLRSQIESAGMTPVADDLLKEGRSGNVEG